MNNFIIEGLQILYNCVCAAERVPTVLLRDLVAERFFPGGRAVLILQYSAVDLPLGGFTMLNMVKLYSSPPNTAKPKALFSLSIFLIFYYKLSSNTYNLKVKGAFPLLSPRFNLNREVEVVEDRFKYCYIK